MTTYELQCLFLEEEFPPKEYNKKESDEEEKRIEIIQVFGEEE